MQKIEQLFDARLRRLFARVHPVVALLVPLEQRLHVRILATLALKADRNETRLSAKVQEKRCLRLCRLRGAFLEDPGSPLRRRLAP